MAETDNGLLSMYEKQVKIYPRAVSGWFAGWRWVMVWLTQLVFYGLPWLSWNGRQAVLFDIDQRQFFVFGLVFHPQDFIYLAALLVISALALFFFTAVAGRLWCGYACPQTVYTEIFLWIERRLEGDRVARIRLDAAPWGPAKVLRKGGKHAAWGLFSMATGFTFVGYFVPIHDLASAGMALAWTPWEWFWIVFYGLATYGNAGFLREQMCKYMCPYARFQSALIDADSLIITYDQRRGEPRGGRARTADPKALGLGDCVDCSLCVQVCPTGIDIRKGLQNECIGCAACIDACDGVMDRLGYSRGLIRYDTENGVARGLSRGQRLRRVFRPRVLIYGALLTALVVAFGTTLGLRSGLKVDVIKDRNTLARIVDDGYVENVYRLHIFNGSELPRRVRLQVSGIDGLSFGTPQDVHVPATGMEAVPVRLRLSPQAAQALRGRSNPIVFQIRDADSAQSASVDEKSAFFVPR